MGSKIAHKSSIMVKSSPLLASALAGFLVGVLITAFFAPLPTAALPSPYQRPYPFPAGYWRATDEFYVFSSGGTSGQVFVYGVPSMKLIATIPVYEFSTEWNWRPEDPAVRKMLTNPWTGELIAEGDTHHGWFSRTNGMLDGRWHFIPDKAAPRVARIDLKTFRTVEIEWVPNLGGIHGNAITPNTEYFLYNAEMEFPLGDSPTGYSSDVLPWAEHVSIVGGLIIDPETGEMSNAWQVLVPFQADIADSGRPGISEDWYFFTTYNSELDPIGVPGMLTEPMDMAFMLNWKKTDELWKEWKAGKEIPGIEVINGVPIFNPEIIRTELGIELLVGVPIPRNPHGIDVNPTGEYVVINGKVTTVNTVISVKAMLDAIARKDFAGTTDQLGGVIAVPFVSKEKAWAAQVELGLGPLHTEFDDKGLAYTSLFVDSQIVRWALPGNAYGFEPWTVVERIPTHFSTGHLAVAGSKTPRPWGKYLIAMNKLEKNMFLGVGPLRPEVHELFDITRIPAVRIDQMPIPPEPHWVEFIPVSLLAEKGYPVEIYQQAPEMVRDIQMAVWEPDESKVVYDWENKKAVIRMAAWRSEYGLPYIPIPLGWTVELYITNIEKTTDITHGWVLQNYELQVAIDPGDVRKVVFKASKPGVWWAFCSWFCSELHLEMRHRWAILPEDEFIKNFGKISELTREDSFELVKKGW
jgi:nitrous-oxide reductase